MPTRKKEKGLIPSGEGIIGELSATFSQPKAEVENLLLHYYKIPRYQLYSSLQNIVDEKILALLEKRKEGYPTQYLTNTAFFLDLELYVDERVFIPRPETEGLVLLVFNFFSSDQPLVVLDMGTGSGNIAISLARLFPNSSLFAADVSPDALAVAEINISKYGLRERVNLFLSDLFSGFDDAFPSLSFDLIIANPPYVPSSEIPFLPKEVRDFEPRVALDGGRDGFFYLKRIIEEGKRFLKKGGKIFLEIDPRHQELIKTVVGEANFYQDLAGRIRYAVC